MIKITRSRTLLLFALITLCYSSCRKDSLNEETALESARTWYLKTIDDGNAVLLSSTGVRSAVNKSMGWNDARRYAIGDGMEIVAVPLTITPLQGNSVTGSALVLITKTNGKYGFVIAHNSQPDYFEKTFSDAEIQEMYKTAVSANARHDKKSVARSSVKGKIMDAPAPGSECIDWYLQTTVRDSYGNVIDYYETYLYTSCGLDENGGSGGGGGGDPAEEEENQKDTDCESFTFVKTSSANWQEAGLNKVALRMVWVGGGNAISVRSLEVNHIVFGLPTYYTNANGTTRNLSAGEAANIAADAAEFARNMTYTEFRNSPTYPSEATIIAYYKLQAHLYMVGHMGTAGVNGSGSSSIIFNDEQRSHWSDPTDC